jgi:predicted phosphate transport protein (TIGR00153 family)
MQLIPRDEKFYELFREQAENILDASQKLTALLQNFEDVEKRVTEIKFVEHKGDQLTHNLIMRLNQTFITPFDREDIYALSSALDDVLDLMDGVAGRLITYKVVAIPPGARQLSRVILHGAQILLVAISELHKPTKILEYCRQLQQLEDDADHIKAECVAQLFENSVDPIEVIKWKEIYEVLEASTDKCEDVANVLEAVVLKST